MHEVVDRSGAPVLELTALDFSIVKDGVELEVVSVTLDLSDGPVPMKIALLVDNSRLFNALNPLRAGLRAFFDSLPSLHEVSLFTIGGHIHRRTGFTADRNVAQGRSRPDLSRAECRLGRRLGRRAAGRRSGDLGAPLCRR